MSENFQVTHTKIVSFDRCRKQYWWRYVSGEPWPEKPASPAGIVGTGVHRAMKALCDTGDPEDGANELGVYLRMPAHECAGPGTEAHALAFTLYERGCAAHAALEGEARWAELDTWVVPKASGIAIRTKLDRADRLTAVHWQVTDWKTGRFDIAEETDAQLDLAHLALRTIRGLKREHTVRAVAWNLRTDRQRIRELRREDAAATAYRLLRLGRRMQAETEFEATPSPWCRLCEWRPRCGEADEAEAADDEWWMGDERGEDEPELS